MLYVVLLAEGKRSPHTFDEMVFFPIETLKTEAIGLFFFLRKKMCGEKVN